MSETRPTRPAGFRALLRAYDLERSVEFYSGALGLRVIERYDREDGPGALVEAGSGIIELKGKPTRLRVRGGWDFIPPVAKIDLVLEVADVAAWHAELVAKGVEPQSAPEEAPGGGLRFAVLDPDETPVVFQSARTPQAD